MNNEEETCNAIPENLSTIGERAHRAIMAVLTECEATDSGGCRSFYSPAEWLDRGEQYGTISELVVVYDGGDLAGFFSLDASYPTYKSHTLMSEALAAEGLYCEECTCWYAAIYEI